MGQMLLTGCEWVDFYVYCKSDFHLERVRFDADFCSEMKMKLDTFYFEYLLPELLMFSLLGLLSIHLAHTLLPLWIEESMIPLKTIPGVCWKSSALSRFQSLS